MENDELARRIQAAEKTINSLAIMCDAQGRILDELLVGVMFQQPDPERALGHLFEAVMAGLDKWSEKSGAPAKAESVRRYCEGMFGSYTKRLPR